MPKSRLRKKHKQKADARKTRLSIEKSKFEKQYTEMMEKQLQEYKNQMSAVTEDNTSQVIDITPQ